MAAEGKLRGRRNGRRPRRPDDEGASLAEDLVDDVGALAELDFDKKGNPLIVHASEAAPAVTPAAGAAPTELDRLRSVGVKDARARLHLEKDLVNLEGQVITDPGHEAVPPSCLIIQPGPDSVA